LQQKEVVLEEEIEAGAYVVALGEAPPLVPLFQ